MQKNLYQHDTINDIINEEKLKPNSGIKLVNSQDKVVYIELEKFIEKILLRLKKKSYLK